MSKNFAKLNKLRLIVIGGNRLNEEYPFKSLLSLKKKYGFLLNIFTEKTHLKKKINSKGNNFQNFLKRNKIKYTKVNSYKELRKKISLLSRYSNTVVLLLNCIFLIKTDIINLFKKNIFNLHLGLLPIQRGAGTTSWQFMSNIKRSAVTIHRVEKSFDNGNIILEKKVDCKNLKKTEDFYNKISLIEKKVIENFVKIYLSSKKFKEKKQKDKESYYMPRLSTEINGFINWSWTGYEIRNFINSFDKPFPGASSFIEGKKFKLTDASLIKSKIEFHPFQYGIIVRANKDYVFVAVKNKLLKVKLQSKNFFSNKNLLGKRIFTPIKFLEKSLSSKSVHQPNKIKIIRKI